MAKPNILVVDSDEGFGVMLSEGLKNSGHYSAICVYSGADALQAVAEQNFDLVIIDVAVSDMKPPKLIKGIRDAKRDTKIMLIPLMGQDLSSAYEKFNINGILPKPFFVGDLPDIVDKAMGRTRQSIPTPPPQPAPTAPKPEPTRPSAPAPETKPEPVAPTPAPVQPEPTQPAAPVSGDVYPQFMNSSFDEYQPFVYEGEAKVWKENRFPEEYGKYWKLDIVKVGKRRFHAMSSKVFAGFTQAYFGGGGHDYHIEGHHSQVFTSRNNFDIVLSQTFAAELGRSYTFSGAIVSFYKGTSGEQKDGEIFKSIGIDPTGGQAWNSDSVIWTDRDGKDNHWRYPSIKAKAQAKAISVFIRIENTSKDVGKTELNTIHLDKFKIE